MSKIVSRKSYLAIMALFLSGILLLAIGQSDIDLMLADSMFDPVGRTFPLRHAWITAKFGHDYLKTFFSILGAIPVLLCLFDIIRPIQSWAGWFRLRVRIVALSAILVPLAISSLKSLSASYCPWDIDRYGGNAPYVHLLSSLPDGLIPGHCLPGGHASSALWLVSLAFFWWPFRPRIAMLAGFTTLMLGMGVGWIQQIRGAHFLTHTLWSMWIACAINVTLFVMLKRISRSSQASGSSVHV